MIGAKCGTQSLPLHGQNKALSSKAASGLGKVTTLHPVLDGSQRRRIALLRRSRHHGATQPTRCPGQGGRSIKTGPEDGGRGSANRRARARFNNLLTGISGSLELLQIRISLLAGAGGLDVDAMFNGPLNLRPRPCRPRAQLGRSGARHLAARACQPTIPSLGFFKTVWDVTNPLVARPVGPDHLAVPDGACRAPFQGLAGVSISAFRLDLRVFHPGLAALPDTNQSIRARDVSPLAPLRLAGSPMIIGPYVDC